MDDYKKFRFSITCHALDLAVVHCLRGLCQWAEQHPKPQIGWGGTTKANWKASGESFTLRFTDPGYRQRFIEKANELLPNRWTTVAKNDNDPATRQRKAVF